MRIFTFFIKYILLFSIPLLVLIGIYLVTDPFKVLYTYEDYYVNNYISRNRDFISTEMYLKNSKKYDYDSFVFGASSAMFMPPKVWASYISTSNPPFSFDAYRENITGIHSKIRFLHSRNIRINNALILIDIPDTFDKFRNEGHIYMKHYDVFRSSKLRFHYESLMSFLNLKFLGALTHFELSKSFYPYMEGVLNSNPMKFDLITNGLVSSGAMIELANDSLGYYKKRQEIFYARGDTSQFYQAQINENYINMLQDIKEVFDEDDTSYRIVINPQYNQLKINPDDLKVIKTIFGKDYVFNFSGKNEITDEIGNYYDRTHFKQLVAVKMLQVIYE